MKYIVVATKAADRDMACRRLARMFPVCLRSNMKIRIDTIWLATDPMHTRASIETSQARVVSVFGVAQAHYAYLFSYRRTTRIKVLGHDGLESAWRLGKISGMTSLPSIYRLNPEQLRRYSAQFVHRVENLDQKIEQ